VYCGLSFLNVSPFSARTATPAARMPQMPMAVRRARAAQLRAAGAAAAPRSFSALLGKPLSVLVERREGGTAFGHSEHFAPVRFEGAAAPGEILALRAGAVDAAGLVAERHC
jgi:threonylcarbamoyladenosine tRNA methylthiotransferase MtaB